MNATTSTGQRPYRGELNGPYMVEQEDQDSEMLRPVFNENSRNSRWFVTKEDNPGLAIYCASIIAINYLNMAHNNCVEQDSGCSKGLKIFAIEIGLFATTFLLAPVEIITRIALGIILAIPLTITYFTSDEDDSEAFDFMNGLSFRGAFATCFFALPHGAISTYTNVAYSNRKIDYEGQFRKFIGEF